MPRYRIGIYDPAFNPQGHFVAFDRYIAELCDAPDIQVVFLDRVHKMQAAYEGRLSLSNAPEFVQVEPAAAARASRIGRIAARWQRYRAELQAIKALDLDLVLITSESYDPLFYLAPIPRFQYALFILNPRLYIFRPLEITRLRYFLFKIYEQRYRALVKHAAVLFTTDEPPMIPELARAIGVPDIAWIPNLPSDAHTSSNTQGDKDDFITIGTISKSKNHLFALEAFESKTLPFSWVVAGLARDSAGKEVERRVHALEKETDGRVHGEFGYLDDARYTALMRSARFALFPYDLARGNISSQVMHDSFRNRVPFVAPDIEPFRYYANTYGVGLLWRENDPDSFAKTLEAALAQGADSFADGFTRLESDHDFRVIQSRFLKCITPLLAERAK